MGATSARWFTDGCCQCVGHDCIPYGINESRCTGCSSGFEEDEDDELLDMSLEELEQEEKRLEEELEQYSDDL